LQEPGTGHRMPGVARRHRRERPEQLLGPQLQHLGLERPRQFTDVMQREQQNKGCGKCLYIRGKARSQACQDIWTLVQEGLTNRGNVETVVDQRVPRMHRVRRRTGLAPRLPQRMIEISCHSRQSYSARSNMRLRYYSRSDGPIMQAVTRS
jgi:hypothetical protein